VGNAEVIGERSGNLIFAIVLIAPFWLGWRGVLTPKTEPLWAALAFPDWAGLGRSGTTNPLT